MALDEFGATAAIISIGDEVVEGRVTNENAAWLSEQLMLRGIWPRLVVAIPDDEQLIVQLLRIAWDAADVVLVSGGLGFTPDDMTRRAVARACVRDIVVDEDVRDALLKTIDWIDPVSATALASFPQGASPVMSSCSGVPGFSVGHVHVLPGAPREVRAMFPQLQLPAAPDRIETSQLRCMATEDGIQEVLLRFDQAFNDVRLGSYPSYDGPGPSVTIVLASRSSESLARAHGWLRDQLPCPTSPVDSP